MGFARFEKAYNEALATINCFLSDNSTNDLRKLTAWLMETDANPYSFLPHEWAGSLGSAESFARLLYFIHLAAGELPAEVLPRPHNSPYGWPLTGRRGCVVVLHQRADRESVPQFRQDHGENDALKSQ
jgi:hypothetical protein